MHSLRSLAATVAVAAILTSGCEWHFETLDGNQNGPHGQVDADVGQYNSVLLYNGRPHVFYWDQDSGSLRHAYDNGQFWAFETLDRQLADPDVPIGVIGEDISSILYKGRPHVFYRDQLAGDLRHAYWNGVFWAFETLDGSKDGANGRIDADVGQHGSTILYNGRPHLFYSDTSSGDLRHGYWNGADWFFETLDGSGGSDNRIPGNVGEFTSALMRNGRPHVFYWDRSNGNLRHSYFTGVTWAFETLDGESGPNGRLNADVGPFTAVVPYNGRPHVFYWDRANGRLRHGYFTGLSWGFENLDGHQNGPNGEVSDDVGQDPTAVVNAAGLHVFYFHDAPGDLRHARYNGSSWSFETLDGHSNGPNGRLDAVLGAYNAATLLGRQPHVFYWDFSHRDLRHAWFG